MPKPVRNTASFSKPSLFYLVPAAYPFFHFLFVSRSERKVEVVVESSPTASCEREPHLGQLSSTTFAKANQSEWSFGRVKKSD